ncbi:MAG: response regulator [Fischerella sp.]|nr:response regulator [Fischerella sp.]
MSIEMGKKFEQEQEIETVKNTETILVIDDSPTNLEVLYSALSSAGYEVLVEMDGMSGIEQVKNNPPDLILLDIMMPKLNGFETCRLLQADLSTKDIPIIFITALADIEEKVKGLSLGAVDYITKPFQQDEVLARVHLQLKLRRLNIELEQQKKLLEKRVEERTAELYQALEQLKKTQLQLVQSERTSSLGQIVAGIVHEVNNPIGLISTNLYYAKNYLEELINLVKLYQQKFPHPGKDIEDRMETMDLEHVLEDLPKLISSMKLGTDNIRGIMQSLRNFSRADGEQKKSVDIHEGIETTLLILQYRLKANPKRPAIQIVREYGNLPKIECYPGQLNQVFMNLLVNAIDSLDESFFTRRQSVAEVSSAIAPAVHSSLVHDKEQINMNKGSRTNPQIRICTNVDKEQVIISLANNAMGIPDLFPSQIFPPFFSTKPKTKGNELGLAISYQIITENHGGKLQCISSPNQGTEFIIQIPL